MKKIKLNNDGAVLFTVICLMSILTVVLMTAIIAASSSNKKSVYNYAENQAYVTAKSTVDTFVKSLNDDTYTRLRDKLKAMTYPATSTTLPLNINVTVPNTDNVELFVIRNSKNEYTLTCVAKCLKSEYSISCKVDYQADSTSVTPPVTTSESWSIIKYVNQEVII